MLEFNGTTIVIAISFIIFVILENIIFYKPMKKIMDERQNYIDSNEKDANDNNAKAQALIDEKDKKMADAKLQSSQIVNETSLKTQEKYSVAVKEAKINSNQRVEEMKNKLENEKAAAQNELRKDIGEHAALIVSKVLKKDISLVNLSDEMIDKALRGEL